MSSDAALSDDDQSRSSRSAVSPGHVGQAANGRVNGHINGIHSSKGTGPFSSDDDQDNDDDDIPLVSLSLVSHSQVDVNLTFFISSLIFHTLSPR